MLRIERRAFEKVVVQIVGSTDIRQLIGEFSLHRVLFYSLLKDISKGKDSPNYHVLKKVAQNKKISEQFIIEQAKIILSYLVPNNPKEDYYKVLSVSPTASPEDIRFNWLNLVKTHHPDRVGDQGLDITKKLNEAYEVLADPNKRTEYDAKCLSVLPVVVDSSRIGTTSRRFIYSIPLTAVIFTLVFYLAGSGLLSHLGGKKVEFIEKVENKTDEHKALVSGSTMAARKFHPSEPKGEKRGIVSSSLKKSGKVPVIQEARTEKNPKEESKNTLQSKETPKLDIKESFKPKTKIEEKGAILYPPKESRPVLPTGGGLIIAQEKTTRVPKPKEERSEYVVKKGDNLWDIARSFNISVNDLKKSNNLRNNSLDLGEILIIPVSQREGIVKNEIGSGELEKKEIKKPLKVAVRKQDVGLQKKTGSTSQMGQKPKLTKNIVREAEATQEIKEESKRETITIKDESKEGSSQKLRSVSYHDKASLYSFVTGYTKAYKNRDINQFFSFFEPDARENGVEILKSISSYEKNFSSLEVIGYDVTIKTIDFEEDKASINGDFLLIFRNKNDERIRSSNGTMNWTLLWQGNRWKVKELNFKVKSTRVEDE